MLGAWNFFYEVKVMAHKVHPKSFRIRGMEDWNTRGFYGKKMTQYLEEDFMIKEFLRNKLAEASVASIGIERSANKINIIIETARPGIVIGRGGGGAEALKAEIEKKIQNASKLAKGSKREIKLEIREVKNPWVSASLVGQWAAQQIEKRIPFRQVLKKGLERVMQGNDAKGVKIEVSGRLNGIEIARKEWLKQGRLPRQTLRADIDYALTEAHCTYGKIGIKVWIYKGDKFE